MYWILFIGVTVLSYAVQASFQKKFQQASECPLLNGMAGREVAVRMLADHGIRDVKVTSTPGQLTDNFNPTNKTVNLSQAVYAQTNVAAAAVAAHECGHVMQHERGYVPLQIRTALVPVANFGSNVGIWVVILGLILGLSDTFVNIGIALFSFGVLFQFVTLPVEINASRRALAMLTDYRILSPEEERGSRAVLRAAAMTYVAAAASSILQLLRLVILAGGRRRDD